MFRAEKVNTEAFANKTSYKAAVWAGAVCNKMLKLQNEDNQFFFESSPIDLVFKFDYDGGFEISLKSSEHSHILFVGDVSAEVKGEWKVWCTKKNLTEFFNQFKFIPKSQFKSVV